MRLDVLREYVTLLVESSMATRRGFESSRSKFHTSDEIPTGLEGSKMVDESGHPIVFYHGTRRDFNQFSRELLNTAGTAISTNYMGFYFTTAPEVAQVYVSKHFDPKRGPAPGARIESFLLNVKNPYYITENTYWKWGRTSRKEMDDLVTRLRFKGHDAVVMPAVWRGRGKGAYDVVVFDPEQIVSLKEKIA